MPSKRPLLDCTATDVVDHLGPFQVWVSSLNDGGVHKTPFDHFQAATHQIMALALVRHQPYSFYFGSGNKSPVALAFKQLADLGLVDEKPILKTYHRPGTTIGNKYTLADLGEKYFDDLFPYVDKSVVQRLEAEEAAHKAAKDPETPEAEEAVTEADRQVEKFSRQRF